MKYFKTKDIMAILSAMKTKKNQVSFNSNYHYQPTPFLSHPFLQSIYNLAEPKTSYTFEREKLYFEDGGHVALDWSQRITSERSPPILFIMHGLTGGSQMNYIKVLVKQAQINGYQCVCLNSRGINTDMTSPMPFVGIQHVELQYALRRVQEEYPNSPIYLLGTSFGGNYLLRYVIQQQKIASNVKALVALAPPFNVHQVIRDMGPVYQKFFVRRYIYETVTKHQEMKYWSRIGLINLQKLQKVETLQQFHSMVTAKILGLKDANQLFYHYNVTAEDINQIQIKTLLMASKDDPIVSFSSMPHQQIQSNQNIQFIVTEKGGHLCWFEGIKPKRWYPKPVIDFLESLQKQDKMEQII